MISRIYYDTAGQVISVMQGSELPIWQGISYIDVEIPEGKYIVRIDTGVTPNVPIYEDLPKSDIKQLQEKVYTIENDATDIAAIVFDLLAIQMGV